MLISLLNCLRWFLLPCGRSYRLKMWLMLRNDLLQFYNHIPTQNSGQLLTLFNRWFRLLQFLQRIFFPITVYLQMRTWQNYKPDIRCFWNCCKLFLSVPCNWEGEFFLSYAHRVTVNFHLVIIKTGTVGRHWREKTTREDACHRICCRPNWLESNDRPDYGVERAHSN